MNQVKGFQEYLNEQVRPDSEAVEFVLWLIGSPGLDLLDGIQDDPDGGRSQIQRYYDSFSQHRVGLRSRQVRDEAAARVRGQFSSRVEGGTEEADLD